MEVEDQEDSIQKKSETCQPERSFGVATAAAKIPSCEKASYDNVSSKQTELNDECDPGTDTRLPCRSASPRFVPGSNHLEIDGNPVIRRSTDVKRQIGAV